MKKTIYILISLFVIVVILNYKNLRKVFDASNFSWLSFSNPDPVEQRTERARKQKGDIKIGVAGPWSMPEYKPVLEGVEFAADEINSLGGIKGRKINLVIKDDEGKDDMGEKVAQEFCNDLDMTAVIGHINSKITRSGSVLYDYNGLIMITPTSSETRLTQGRENGLIFRNSPSNDAYARALASYIKKVGYKYIVLYIDTDTYSDDFADCLGQYAYKMGIEIADRKSYDSTCSESYLLNDLELWVRTFREDIDALVIIGLTEEAVIIVRQTRLINDKFPILGSDTLHNDIFLEQAGKYAEGIAMPSFDTAAGPADLKDNFRRKFIERYSHEPCDYTMSGYETLNILANAITKAGSTVPSEIAGALRKNTYNGLFGTVSFNDNGELVQERVNICVIKNSQFVKVEDIESLANVTQE